MPTLAPGPYRSLIRRIWRTVLVGLLMLVLYIAAVRYNVFYLFGGMPSLKALENPRSEVASEVFSDDGALLGKYYLENRSPVELGQISPNVVKALLSTEDARFARHSGIDPRSMFRAVFGILTFQNTANTGGGSTLTQQTAKNLFDTRGEEMRGLLGNVPLVGTVIAKTKEWILSVRLERNYTKPEILMMYLNTVSFGNNTFGIRTASRTYFNKEPRYLTVPEAALLVGMLKNPSRFDPRVFEQRSVERRNVVLSQMRKYGFLTDGEFEDYTNTPLALDFSIENQNTNRAPYFISVIKEDIKKWLEEYNGENPGAELNLYTSGLKIYTTIDSRMQAYAEAAVLENMRDQQRKFNAHWGRRNPWVTMKDGRFVEMKGFLESAARRTPRYKQLKAELGDDEEAIWQAMRKPQKMKVFSYSGKRSEKDTTLSPLDSIRYYKRLLNTGFMSMDPNTGYVRAWVGGISFKYMKFDHVKQSRRQPGSTFKPFVYLTALNNNYLTPCDKLTDQPTTVAQGEDGNGGGAWTPQNSTGKYSYRSLSLRQALGESINTISVQLIKKTKVEPVIKTAADLGLDTDEFPHQPALCLGTADVSVYEMVAAYCAFANGGHRVKPMTIVRITDKEGNVLKTFPLEARQVISADKAYEMLYLMRGATEDPNGTAARLRSSQYNLLANSNQIAAKTGTTSNYSDGWFMGMTQGLVSGLWVGGDDRAIHFRSIEYGQGARLAMPAWGGYMKRVYADATLPKYKPGPFRKPVGFEQIDCGGYYIDSSQRYIPPKVEPAVEEGILN